MEGNSGPCQESLDTLLWVFLFQWGRYTNLFDHISLLPSQTPGSSLMIIRMRHWKLKTPALMVLNVRFLRTSTLHPIHYTTSSTRCEWIPSAAIFGFHSQQANWRLGWECREPREVLPRSRQGSNRSMGCWPCGCQAQSCRRLQWRRNAAGGHGGDVQLCHQCPEWVKSRLYRSYALRTCFGPDAWWYILLLNILFVVAHNSIT